MINYIGYYCTVCLPMPRSRETANLEYLKNIILHYMSSDKTGKDHMINAIATVLHFSPHEVSSCPNHVMSCDLSPIYTGTVNKAESIRMVGNYMNTSLYILCIKIFH